MTATTTSAGTEARCLAPHCGRKLSSAKSVARGYGDRCWAKVRKAETTADLSAWTAAQIAEAEQAIEDGAVVPSNREGVFHVVSTDGTEVHRTHLKGCNCTNGLLTRPVRPCYHRCAIAIVTAAEAPADVKAAAPVALPAGSAPTAADSLTVLAGELSAANEAGTGDILPVLTDIWAELDRLNGAFMAA